MAYFKTRRMRGVTADKLRSNGWVDKTLADLVQEQKWPGTDCGKLQFYALVERALRQGRAPGALFWHLIASQSTRVICGVDETNALNRLGHGRRTA